MSSADAFVVHKFGGTSVGNAECFARVSDIVSALPERRVAVVVSAIGGKPKVTDLLISLLELAKRRRTAEIEGILASIRDKHRAVIAALLPPLPPTSSSSGGGGGEGEQDEDEGGRIEREIAADLARISELLRAISIMQIYTDNVVEFVSGHGEIWSAKVLAAVLNRRARGAAGPRYQFVDAREFLTVEADEDRGPVVLYDESEAKMRALLAAAPADARLVITGFICSTREGVMTTLKRDGSDFTASICGRVLHASSVTIWTDVSGVLSADPRRVPESKILPEVSYEEAMELAYFGAKVIHPKTMSPMVAEDIPILIRNTFEPEHPGTKISNRARVELKRSLSNGARTARNIVSGFSTVDDLALFNIEGSGMVGVHGTSSRLFGALDRAKISVVLIAQASSEHSICFAVPMQRAQEAKEAVDEAFFKEIHVGAIDRTEFIAPVSIIAAVGDSMNATPGVCARFFGALGRAKINVLAISQGSSERNISAVVRFQDSAAALRAVHSAFFLSDQTISVGIVGLELDAAAGADGRQDTGRALLAQFHQQRDFLTQRFNVDIRLRAVATHSSARMLLDADGGLSPDAVAARDAPWRPFDHAAFLDHVCADHLPHWLIIDVSDCAAHVERLYPSWLSRKVHVITSNVNVGAAPASLWDALRAKTIENELTFDPEACLAIGVPMFHTIQNFVQTGDEILRVEYSGSRFLHAVLDAAMAPPAPPAAADLAAVMQAQLAIYRRELSVRDVLDDVTGVRSAKKAVLLARELGFSTELQAADVQSDWLVDDAAEDVDAWSDARLLKHLVDHSAALREHMAAAERDAQVVRLMTHIDAAPSDPRRVVRVRLERLPGDHAFAALRDGKHGAFAFYTRRHARHPVVVSGPIADTDITAGTLFGSTLHLARVCGARDSGK